MTAPLYAYDAAYSPDLAQCIARGAIAMTHYVSGIYSGTSPQPAATRAAGMGAVLNWERMPGALVGLSRSGGQAVGREFLNSADPACPQDRTVAAYFSVDLDVLAGNLSSCDQAFLGIRDVLQGFRVAVYGEGDLIDHLVGVGILDGKHWLSMSEAFGGFNAQSPNVCLVQMHDGVGNWIGTDMPGTDRNTVTDVHALGAWWPTGSPYLIGDPPMTPAEIQSVADAVWAHNLAGTSNHTAAFWETNINALEAQILTAVQGWTGVALTDAQVTAIAAQVAAHLPTYTGTLTPTAP